MARYERIPFVEKHAAVLPLIPPPPCRVLDIGAGTGADAAWLAAAGYAVVAVEPADALRHAASARHGSRAIEWVNDSLPGLVTFERRPAFDVVMVTAVWMHLDEAERERAMPVVASLLRPRGLLTLTLRHGVRPPGRHMFDVSGEETTALAVRAGLRPVLDARTESVQPENRRAGVTWSRLAFVR